MGEATTAAADAAADEAAVPLAEEGVLGMGRRCTLLEEVRRGSCGAAASVAATVAVVGAFASAVNR